MQIQNDIRLALSLLTRLPIRLSPKAYDRSAEAAWAYPLVGLVTGTLSASFGLAALAIGLSPVIAALLTWATSILLTGAMHEDGLADCADGFWGGWDPEMRLKIMKDSQIGTYGVLALGLTGALRIAALTAILPQPNAFWTLIALHVASRAVMPIIMASLPNARQTGLSHSVGRVTQKNAWIALVIGTASLLLTQKFIPALILIAITALICCAAARLAKTKIGGQTGDVVGAHQQLAELGLLLALTV